MKTLKTVVIVFALLFLVVAAAEAIDLYTPLLYINGSDCVWCTISNVSTADKTVRIRIIDNDGIEIFNSGEVTLEPGKVYYCGTNVDSYVFCRFTFTGSKTQVRAAAKISPGWGVSETIAIRAE